MADSHFLALLIGRVLFIIAVAFVINHKNMRPYFASITKHTTFMVISGILALIIGHLIVMTHWVWAGWPLLITLIGALAIIKGFVRLSFSNWSARVISHFAKPGYYCFLVVLLFVVSSVLLYCGYYL